MDQPIPVVKPTTRTPRTVPNPSADVVSPLRDRGEGNALKIGDELIPLDTPRADKALRQTPAHVDEVAIAPMPERPTGQQISFAAKQAELSLGFTMEINVVRSERQHCPSCGARRVLYHLAAWVKGQPAGSGRALCARCAGFRAGSRG